MKKHQAEFEILVLTFMMLLTFNLKVSAQTFSDLPAKHWAYNAVNSMTEKGVITGYTDGTFKPSNHVTRAEFAKLIVTTLGLDEEKNTNPLAFEDVKETSWAYDFVKSAGNYLSGKKVSGKWYFYPNNDAVREDMAIAVVVASGLSNVDYNTSTLSKFSDISKASEEAKKYIAIAVEHGLMKGNANGTFNPKGTLTRAEAAQLMLNYNKSTKVSLADLDKNKKSDDTKPVLYEKYGYIDLGTNFNKYEYSDDGTWHKATERYIHKSSNKLSGSCNNVYYTDVTIREVNNKNATYSFKIPFVSLIRPEYDKSTKTVDLGENWHAYDILSTNDEELSNSSGTYKWVKAPDRYIVKGEEFFDKDYLYVRFEEKNKTGVTLEAIKFSDGTNGLTWKETTKVIEYKTSGYKITNENGKIYLTVSAGPKSTSGYSIAITNVAISGYNITVTTQETVPAKGAVTVKGAYYPSYTIELSARPDKVTMKKLASITADRNALTWTKTTKQIEYKSSGYKITEEDGKVYLTVGTGSRSTTGYKIEITNVEVNGFNITVTTQETVPGKGASTTKQTNYPTATIELSAKPDKVTIKKLEAKAEGGQALTWKETTKQIEYKSSSYKITQEDGKTYLTVGTGSRATTGYSIKIVDVEISGYDIIVSTQETVPGKGASTTKQTNYPTATIELSAKPEKVTLKKLENITAGGIELTWKETSKQIEYKSASYKITEEDGKVYLTVGLGSRASSGYSIAIKDVQINGYNITVTTQETIPGKGAAVTKGTYYPTATIELSTKPDKVTLSKLSAITDQGVALTWKTTSKVIELKNSSYKVTESDGKIYLTVGLGPRDTTGYTAEITDVTINGYNITVTVQESTPSKDDKVTKTTTYPTATIELSAKPDKVTINKAAIKYGGEEPLTWKNTDKVIEYRAAGYRVTEVDGKVYLQYGLGEQKTDGYEVKITNATVKGKDITITVQETRPGKGQPTKDVVNYPVATIELSARPDNVIVNKLPVIQKDVKLNWKLSYENFNYDVTNYEVKEIDGKVYLVIGVGKRATSGYSIDVTDVSIKGYEITVTVQERTPAKGFLVNNIANYPQVALELTAKPDKVTINRLTKKQADRLPIVWQPTTEYYEVRQKSYKITQVGGNWPKCYLSVGTGARKTSDYSLQITDVKFDGYNATVYAQEYTPAPDIVPIKATTYPSATVELTAVPDKVTVVYADPVESAPDTSLKVKSTTRRDFPYEGDGYRIEKDGGKTYVVIGVGNKPYQFTLRRKTYEVNGDNLIINTMEYVGTSNKVGGSWNATVAYEVNKEPDKVIWTHDSYQLDSPTSKLEWSEIIAPGVVFSDLGGNHVRKENDYWVVTICPGNFKNWQYFLVFDVTRDGDKLIINCVREEGNSTGPNHPQSTSIKVNFEPTSVVTNWIVN